ncbi:MAG TPA: ribosome small subunit-dependent GTPase A [Thermoanaerobaculia bacterium]|nr:ribosome small subunit-dependent GTPase A [Thermoanaerobaculia bacterium]
MADSQDLRTFGWGPWLARRWEAAVADEGDAEKLVPGRIVAPGRGIHRVAVEGGELLARPAGRLRAEGVRPAVGDWVAVERLGARDGLIRRVLPRRTKLARKVPGARTEEQVLAADVDRVFLVMGLDGDFSPRRIERLAVVAREGGAEPVVVLTKADLVGDEELAARIDEVRAAAPGTPVFAVSVPAGRGLEPLAAFLVPGETIALLGSSGAGKSTLLNRLVGREVMATGAVREHDSRGRHTTVHRELVVLPNGSLLIDNPGLREVQLWTESGEGLEETFEDVEELAAACRFRNCTHRHEPGCAVREAIEQGRLDPARLEAYRELAREREALERRRDEATARKHGRAGSLMVRAAKKDKARRGEE